MSKYIILIYILIALAVLSANIGLASDPAMNGNDSAKNQVAASSASSQIVFVQMNDIHLSDKKFKDSYFGNETNLDPVAFTKMTVQEIKALKPAFVVAVGDLVAASDVQDTNTASIVFSTFNNTIQPLILAGIPVHEVVGNHDVVGVNNKTVKTNETGYGKALFLKTFGLSSTYYSFDQGRYHFIVLDPNNIDNKWNMTGKGLTYAINDSELSWLTQDLSKTDSPVIAFIHEPLQDLKNPMNVSKVLMTKNTEMIFSAHWHQNEMLNASGVPEQTNGAVSAAWWQGHYTDGSPEGYRVVVLNGSRIDSFYKAAGVQRQINIIEPVEAIVNGEVNLKAQIWSNSTIRNASYSIDNSSYMPMSLSREGIWYASSAKFNASQLSQGYHIINVKATDGNASLSNNVSLKVSDNKTLAISDLMAHYMTYMGKHVTVEGVVTAVFQNSNMVVIQDATGGVHVSFGDCYQPPKFAIGELWTITAKALGGGQSLMPQLALIKSSDANKSTMSAQVPMPAVKNATDIGSSTVGLLVQIKNANVSSIDKAQSGFTIQDSTGKAYVNGQEAMYNKTSLKTGDIVDITGIGQQNKHKYEVTLRNSSDVVVHKK